MTLRERLRNPFVQQYLLEIILPLAGYFFFDWTLVIIAAFYLIDQIASESSFIRKFSAISKAENKSRFLLLIVSTLSSLAMLSFESYLLIDYFTLFEPTAEQNISNELKTFAAEELWLLLPVVLLMYYVKDQFTFFVPRRFLLKESRRFFIWHWIENILLMILVFSATQLLKNHPIPDAAVITIFLVLKISFDFSIVKFSDKKSNKQ
ncbi:MAG: hypothetical protein IPM74_09965 [Crocinitomicaceae bacterium]|nr:hypothetical protein [Crocinitomicaceae bacterium]MBK8926218.1 hypothetical protein [Crocinitomicaceae bacterium]